MFVAPDPPQGLYYAAATDRVRFVGEPVAVVVAADRIEAAVTADGIVTGLRVDLTDNVGAYLRPPEPSTLYRCFGNITGAYRIPAVRIRARAVVTNTMPTGLNRGFGGQQLYFGLERLMDKVAASAALDPAEARRRNFIGPGEFPYRTPTGGVYDSGDYRQAFDLALKNADYDSLRAEQAAARARGEYFGIGLAAVVDPSATNIGYVALATPASRWPTRCAITSASPARISAASTAYAACAPSWSTARQPGPACCSPASWSVPRC